MRILYHHRILGNGAEGVHVREVISSFRALEHEVRLVALVNTEAAGATKQHRLWSTVNRCIPGSLYELAEVGYNIFGRRALSQAIREFRPDFVYDRYNLYSTAAVEAARRAGIPVLLEVNTPYAYERTQYDAHPLRFPRLAARFEKKICTLADHIFVVSTPLKEFLVARESVPERKISVLVNGADPDAFDPTLSGNPIRERFNIGSQKVVGFVGALRPWHGLDILLAAFSLVVKRTEDAHLLIVGGGPLEAELKEMIRTLDLQQHVTFSGQIRHADVPQYLAAFDIGVTARTTFCASPMKIIEYMAMGRPTVAPRTPNITDILEERKDGLLFEPGIASSLAEALLELLADGPRRRQMGAAAREKVESQLNWHRNAASVIERAQRIVCCKS